MGWLAVHRVNSPAAHEAGSAAPAAEQGFPAAAAAELEKEQLRRNLARATTTIRARRAAAVALVDDWEELRTRGAAIKDYTLANLDQLLVQLEASVRERGGTVHWARDAVEANAIVTELVRATGSSRVIKMKSIATDEIGLNDALAAAGIEALETDLAELILQLGNDTPSHVLVPAVHRNRTEIRDLFRREFNRPDLSDDPRELTAVAREHLRELFFTTKVGVSGANFAIAETGSICVLESEGNGRMCTTLPETLISVVGIEKVVPTMADLATMLRLLPPSSTGEPMNPYTSIWTGTREGDGPKHFHLVLLDNGRTRVLADPEGRDALRCIRCSACQNVCPVYERTGGHAYESVYAGPIGAILSPQLAGLERSTTLPWASSLCGACYEVCPVKIDIPSILIRLRGRVVRERRSKLSPEALAMEAVARTFASQRRYEAAQRASRIASWPLPRAAANRGLAPKAVRAWTEARDLPQIPRQTFRQWWRERRRDPEPPPGPQVPGSPGSASRPQPPSPAGPGDAG